LMFRWNDSGRRRRPGGGYRRPDRMHRRRRDVRAR
jgi:hypothetical protein